MRVSLLRGFRRSFIIIGAGARPFAAYFCFQGDSIRGLLTAGKIVFTSPIRISGG